MIIKVRLYIIRHLKQQGYHQFSEIKYFILILLLKVEVFEDFINQKQ